MKTWRRWLVGVFVTLCLAGAAAAQSTAVPRVEGFDVEEVSRLAPGTTLRFTVSGTPGAVATLRIEGAQRTVALAEVEPGLYEGAYVLDASDRIAPDARVTADLRLGHRTSSAELEEPLVLGTAARVAAAGCRDCGVVQAVQAVEVPGEPGALGAVAGGVVGAIIGNQVGRDHRVAARILGALGGAYAGREIERAHRQRTHYDVVLRLDDGSVQRRRYSAAPPFRAGDRVRIAGDRWLRETDADVRRAAAAF